MSSRIQHKVTSTRDAVTIFGATIGVSGSATGLVTTLQDSTELHCTVSGTSPGRVVLTLPSQYSYPGLIAWGCDMHAGSTSSLDYGGRNQLTKERYTIQGNSFTYANGAQIVGSPGSRAGYYANPTTGGGASFSFEISKLVQSSGTFAGVAPISATLADPIDASVAPGSPTAKIGVWAIFQNRSR